MRVGEIFNPHKMFDGIWIIDPMKRSKLISPGAKLCYGQLKRYAGKNGEAFPSHERLADEIGVKARMVRNYIKELKDNGFIIVEHTRTVNHYKFVWHEIFEESIKVKDDTRQDVATPPGNILPPYPARCCHPEEPEKPLPDMDKNAVNEDLRESFKENQLAEAGNPSAAPVNNLKSKEVITVYLQKLEDKKLIPVQKQDRLIKQFTDSPLAAIDEKQVIAKLKHWFKGADDYTVKQGYPLGLFIKDYNSIEKPPRQRVGICDDCGTILYEDVDHLCNQRVYCDECEIVVTYNGRKRDDEILRQHVCDPERLRYLKKLVAV